MVVFGGVSFAPGNRSEASYTKTVVYHTRNIPFLERQHTFEGKGAYSELCETSKKQHFRKCLSALSCYLFSWTLRLMQV